MHDFISHLLCIRQLWTALNVTPCYYLDMERLARVHTLKAWFAMQECSQLGLVGSDQILNALISSMN
jgi:hypothetical protein